MANRYACLGFNSKLDEAIAEILMSVRTRGKYINYAGGCYHVLSPAPGAEIWTQFTRDEEGNLKEQIMFAPHFQGESRMRISAEAIASDKSAAEGVTVRGYAGCAEVCDGQYNRYTVNFSMPDFGLSMAERELPFTGIFNLSGFAESLICFPSSAEYRETGGPPIYAAGRPFQAVEEFIIPGSNFLNDEGEEVFDETSYISGTVISTEYMANTVTGLRFLHSLISTYGGSIDIVAPVSLVRREPVTGGIMQGRFRLSGRLHIENLFTQYTPCPFIQHP